MEPSKQPTIEELQAQLVELQDKQKESDAKIEQLSSENSKLTDDLGKARELNTRLFLKIPQGNNINLGNEDESAPEEDSFDKLLDEVFEKYVEKKNQTS